MAYTPTNWVTGDTVTATKLNKLEQGVANAGSALICTCSWNGGDYVLDKTAKEIYDALLGGTPAYVKFQYGVLDVSGIGSYESTMYLTPIIKVWGYGYTNTIKIMASKPTFIGSDFVPALVFFGTSEGLNSYPTYSDTRYVNYNSTTGAGGVI